MTDVPPDSGAPGAQPAQPWDPSGIRRSNFTPAPPDADPPTFDDDALADAMAAEVSPYTSEIKLPHLLPPAGAEFGAPPPVADVPTAPPIPLVEPGRFGDAGVSEDTAPITPAAHVTAPDTAVADEEDALRRAIGGASTLEAMERLEDEFRRLSGAPTTGETAAVPTVEAAPPAPAPEAAPASAADGEVEDVFAWLSSTAAPAVPEPDAVEPEPVAPVSEAESEPVTPTEPEPAAPTEPELERAALEPEPELAAPAAVEPEPLAPDVFASIFDIPGTAAATPAHADEPSLDDHVADDSGPTAEPAEAAFDDSTGAAAVEPALPPVAPPTGSAWHLPDPEDDPAGDQAEFLPAEREPPVLRPLPGTDALGWNTPPAASVAPAPLTEPEPAALLEPDAEPEPEPVAEPEPLESESGPLGPEPEPLAPESEAEPADFRTNSALPASLGTEVWSLFPDEGAAELPPLPDQSAFDLPAPIETAIDEPPTAETPPEDPPADEPAPRVDSPGAFDWLFPSSTADVSSIDEPSIPLSDPTPDAPADGPVAFESLAPATASIAIIPPAASSFPGLPPVDESLIDPVAAAAAEAATLAASIPPPLPTPAPEPWMSADPTDDGVWDLGVGEPTPTPIPAEATAEEPPPAASESFPEPEPDPEPDALAPDPAIAAAAAAAALVAASPAPLPPFVAPAPDSLDAPNRFEPNTPPALTPPPSDDPFALSPIQPVPAPVPTVLPSESGPQFGAPVPYSTEPPVGPESPDWLDAPPPVYTPPELVEPPQFGDGGANPALDPVSPITANTMARLPIPLPTEQPNIADRAELPPPPGYEDIPIMSSDAAAQSTTVAPLFSAPASVPATPVPSVQPDAADAPSIGSPVDGPASAEAPAAESPVPESPAVETPASTSPAAEAAAPVGVAFAPPFAPSQGGSLAFPSEPLLPVPPSAPPVEEYPVPAVAGTDVEANPTELDPPSTGAGDPAQNVPDIRESASLDDEDDDAIDELDRVPRNVAAPIAGAVAFDQLPPPAEPIATARLADDDHALVVEEPQPLAAPIVETAGVEPTPVDLRVGRAARLFWLWFAANSSVVSLGLGAVLLSTGMSLRQSIVATLAGVAISFLPLGLGTLAGKWSGQPTMVVSRATFGHAGNILPALLAVVARVFWGGVLLWLLATAVAQVLVGAGIDGGLGTMVWQLIGLVVGFVIATVVAVFGYGFVARLQLVLSIVNGLLILGAAALTFQHLDFARALTVPDGSWVLAIGGAAIVFSVIGLAWVHSSSDLARYQRPGSSGGSSMLWATFGATLPPFLLICWGAMLAASDSALATKMQTNPLAAIATLLPAWYPAPLLIAAALGLLSGAVLTIYSGGFALLAVGARLRRSMSTLVAAVLVLAAAGALIFVVPDFASVVTSLIITIAVPVAAWAGIFAAEMMIRTRRFHTRSLLAPGGVYPQVRWLNLIALIVISVVGYGFVTSKLAGFGWEGYLFTVIGVAPSDPFGASNIGVFVALLLGLVVPLAGGIPAIRRQEAEIVDPAPVVPTTAPIVRAAPAAIEAPRVASSLPVATPTPAATSIPPE